MTTTSPFWAAAIAHRMAQYLSSHTYLRNLQYASNLTAIHSPPYTLLLDCAAEVLYTSRQLAPHHKYAEGHKGKDQWLPHATIDALPSSCIIYNSFYDTGYLFVLQIWDAV